MIPFDFHCPTRIIFGPGKLNELGSLASGLGAKRVLVVSDRGIGSTSSTIVILSAGVGVAVRATYAFTKPIFANSARPVLRKLS